MNTNASKDDVRKDARAPSCSASSSLNFAVGAVAIIVAAIIGYLVYSNY